MACGPLNAHIGTNYLMMIVYEVHEFVSYRQWFFIDFYLPEGFGCYTLFSLAFAGCVTKTTIKIYYPRYNEGMVEATKEKNHHLIFNNPSWKINENKVVEQSKPSACNPFSAGQHQSTSTLNGNVGVAIEFLADVPHGLENIQLNLKPSFVHSFSQQRELFLNHRF